MQANIGMVMKKLIVAVALSFKNGIPFLYLLNLKGIKIMKKVAVDTIIIAKVKNSLGILVKSNIIDKIKVAIKKAKVL